MPAIAQPDLDVDIRKALKRSGLEYVIDLCPGLMRKRRSNGFVYWDGRGRRRQYRSFHCGGGRWARQLAANHESFVVPAATTIGMNLSG